MTLDEQLRQTLREQARRAPDGSGLLEGVRQRSRRLGRRNFGLLSVALITVAAISATYLLATSRPPAPPAASLLGLTRADYRLTGFPLEPAWTPPGFEDEPRMSFEDWPVLTYWGTAGLLTVEVTPQAPSIHWPGTDTPTTVNGHPATLRLGDSNGVDTGRLIGLSWQPGEQWIVLWHNGSLAEADVRRFAENLRPGEISPRPGFAVGLVPGGFVLGGYAMGFDDVVGIIWFRGGSPGTTVHFELRRDPLPTAGPDPGLRVVKHPLGSGQTMVVSTNLTEEQLSNAELMDMARSAYIA